MNRMKHNLVSTQDPEGLAAPGSGNGESVGTPVNVRADGGGGGGVLSANQEPRCNAQRMSIVLLLVAQNCAAVIMLRFTRTRADVQMYSITALVLAQELLKLFLSCLWLLFDVKHAWSGNHRGDGAVANSTISIVSAPSGSPTQVAPRRHGIRGVLQQFSSETFSSETYRMILPAVLFTVQNALLVVALENLDATLFQLIYQAKTCVTALFMVAMLGRSFSTKKWFCMIVLVAGVVLVQLKPDQRRKSNREESMFIGVVCVALCACSSAFAGVYMEKVFKDKKSILLSARNVHLSGFSVATCLATMIFTWATHLRSRDGGAVLTSAPVDLPSGSANLFEWVANTVENFFVGFDVVVWVMVANQAAGGLLVALLIKYADNIMKSIATALAIIASGVVSYFLFAVAVPNVAFIVGAAMIVGAALCYSFVD